MDGDASKTFAAVLEEYRYTVHRINDLKIKLSVLHDRYTSASGIRYDRPDQGRCSSLGAGADLPLLYVIQKDEIEDEIRELEVRRLARRAALLSMIEAEIKSDSYQQIARLRYVEDIKPGEMEGTVPYARSSIYRAMRIIDKLLKVGTK